MRARGEFDRVKPVTVRDYIEVSKPRIVVVLVVTAIASLLAATRFDSTPAIAWDVSAWQIGFLTLAGALAPIEARAPARVRKPICQALTSHAMAGVESNLVAAKSEAIAVTTSTTTILGFDTSM